MALTLCLALCLVTFAFANPDQPSIGYKGGWTPRCADGTIYATSRSSCSYPSAAILAWIQQNNAGYQQLYSSVAVQSTIPDGQFPKQVSGKESCDFSEDYAALQWVYSPDLGWMPVMQAPNAPQYFRLESCTSRACNAGCGGTGNCQTQCRTFHTRQRVLVWDGVQAVSTVVLLPYACKCVIDSTILPGIPNPPLPPFTPTCNPYIDCTCPCAAYDSACLSTRIISNQCRAPGLPQPSCNPYFDCACACAPNDWNCLAYRQKANPCPPAIGQQAPKCNPATDCTCPCRADDYACVSARFQNPQCYAPPRDCNPYLSCECDCGFDYRCVSYRALKRICGNSLVSPVAAPEPITCDPYRHCHCPCSAGDWKCHAYKRENCREHKRWEGHHRRHHDFGSRSGSSSGSSESKRRSSSSSESKKRSSSSESNERCHCNSLKWGPWCKDPEWRCLTDEERLKRIG